MKNQLKNFENFLGLRPRPHQGLCPLTPAGGLQAPCHPLRERLPSRYPLIPPPTQNPEAASDICNGFDLLSFVSPKASWLSPDSNQEEIGLFIYYVLA